MLNQKLQGMVSGSLEASEIRRKLSDYFAARSDVDTVLLFGSFAKGTSNAHSDIDIAIHSDSELGFDELSEIQTDLALLCRRKIDLADLSKAEGGLPVSDYDDRNQNKNRAGCFRALSHQGPLLQGGFHAGDRTLPEGKNQEVHKWMISKNLPRRLMSL